MVPPQADSVLCLLSFTFFFVSFFNINLRRLLVEEQIERQEVTEAGSGCRGLNDNTKPKIQC